MMQNSKSISIEMDSKIANLKIPDQTDKRSVNRKAYRVE